MPIPDAFTQALGGDRRGSKDAVVAPVLAPELRARRLVQRLASEGPSCRVETPDQRLHIHLAEHGLTATRLATRDLAAGLLCVWELRGYFSHTSAAEGAYRGLVVWDADGFALYEAAAVPATPAS
jgi:hypothetical protein